MAYISKILQFTIDLFRETYLHIQRTPEENYQARQFRKFIDECLKEAQRATIRNAYRSGLSDTLERFGVTNTTIEKIDSRFKIPKIKHVA